MFLLVWDASSHSVEVDPPQPEYTAPSEGINRRVAPQTGPWFAISGSCAVNIRAFTSETRVVRFYPALLLTQRVESERPNRNPAGRSRRARTQAFPHPHLRQLPLVLTRPSPPPFLLLSPPPSQANKRMEAVDTILEELCRFGLRRREPILAVGGGVLLDIVGMAASLYRRGVPFVRVPTTLLSLVDASVGVKNGVDYCSCSMGPQKNRVGTFYAPVGAFLDKSFIATQVCVCVRTCVFVCVHVPHRCLFCFCAACAIFSVVRFRWLSLFIFFFLRFG